MSDDIPELKRQAEQNIYSFLQADGSGKGFICPVCQSGSGKKGSGKKGTGMTQDPQRPGRYHCWACGLDCDVIELIGRIQTNSENPTEITKTACEHIRKTLGIKSQFKTDTQMIQSTHNTHTTQNMYNTQNTHNDIKDPVKEKAEQEQIKRTIKEAEKHLSESDYLTKRGISEKTAKRFRCGFIKQWTNPKAPNSLPSPRLIIPTSEYSYLARDTRENLTETQKNFSKQKAGGVHIFNEAALFDYTQPCFITEGEIDALSIIEKGYNACALGGISNINKLATALQERTCAYLILYLDSDDRGKMADIKLQETLSALGKAYTTITGKAQHKDPNDFLVACEGDFQQFLAEAQAEANNALLAEKNEYVAGNNVVGYLDDFLNENENRATALCVPTGFRALDKVLDGGLYEGLYILGALSSLGKTTLILQIADQMSEQGHDVMFFSLEQSRHELIAKSLSRFTAQICEKQDKDVWQKTKWPQNAFTIRDIQKPHNTDNLQPGQLEAKAGAVCQYREKGKNLYIIEGIGDIGVKDIRAAVERHIRATGNKPVVFVDYLQILTAPDDKNRSDKQVVDINISDLKRLSRDLKLTIFGISSFNRESYSTNVGMSAFKESGAIEYSSDVLIGLQFADIDYSKQTDSGKQSIKDQIAEAKNKNPRPVQLVILKNRNGALGDVEFEYFPAYNLYKEKVDPTKMW